MSKYKPGDRVEVKVVGEVVPCEWDGALRVAADEGSVQVTLHDDVVKRNCGVQVRRVAPKKPEVGEVIDGERLKATPWRRGTVIRRLLTCAIYTLNSEGVWVSADRYFLDFGFGDVKDSRRFEVVYLP